MVGGRGGQCQRLLKLRPFSSFSARNLIPVATLFRPNVVTSVPSNSQYSKKSLLRLHHSARSTHVCRMKGSDMISQLELGKPEDNNGKPMKAVNGIFWIILLNLGIYVADHFFLVRGIQHLYLHHSRPVWYQFVTATFCHANWNNLSSNLFFLYIFGKLVEEEEGIFALWLFYIFTGAGANLVSWLVLPRNAVSVGASGAVFGLFAISVLVKVCNYLPWFHMASAVNVVFLLKPSRAFICKIVCSCDRIKINRE